MKFKKNEMKIEISLKSFYMLTIARIGYNNFLCSSICLCWCHSHVPVPIQDQV